jgi:hypothetical protein
MTGADSSSGVRTLRYVIGGFVWLLAAYALLAKGDLLGAALFGVVAWFIWPKRGRRQVETFPPRGDDPQAAEGPTAMS